MPDVIPALSNAPAQAAESSESSSTVTPRTWQQQVIAFCKRFSLLLLGFALMLVSFAFEKPHQQETPPVALFTTKGPLLAATGKLLSFIWSATPYLLEHLGVVLIVAVLVRELIEKAREAEFIGAVNDNLGKTLDQLTNKAFEPVKAQIATLQANLGITIQRRGVLDPLSLKELTDKVLNAEFLRTEYILDLTIEPYPSPAASPDLYKGYVLITCKTSYTVKNLTDSPKFYEVSGWMEVMEDSWFPPGIEKTKFTHLAFGPIEKKVEDSQRDFPVGNLQTVAEEALRLKYKLQEPIPANKEYFVQLEGKQTMRSQDLFIWSMSALTTALVVKVTLAGGFTPANFNVAAREMHHHSPMETPTTSATFTWKIASTLLPFQGVQLWWSPKEIHGAAQGSVIPATAIQTAATTPPAEKQTAQA